MRISDWSSDVCSSDLLTFGPSRRQWWWTSGGRRPMSTYNHILVALALDQTGRTVLKRACALAKLFGARLSVLHVVEYIPIESGELLMTAPVALTPQLDKTSRQQLEALFGESEIPPTDIPTQQGPVT